MRLCKAAILAAVSAVVLSAVPADSGHPIIVLPIVKAVTVTAAPVATAPAASTSSSSTAAKAGSSSSAGASIVAGFIAAVAVVIIYHELTRKRCNEKHSTWVDPRHDVNPQAKLWTDPCKTKRPANVVSVRG